MSTPENEPADKRPKLAPESVPVQCKHYVQRKKRFCKMTVAKGKEYCGEHEVHSDVASETSGSKRIPCPLDPKHSISEAKLEKHLKICNAKPTERPPFIEVGVNVESEDDSEVGVTDCPKLSDVPAEELKGLIELVSKLYEDSGVGHIEELMLEHPSFKKEMTNETYGPQTLKHLVQSASLLGIVQHQGFLRNDTAFIEFGAGKGQVAFWLATILQENSLTNTKVLLLDRASHRHKKDNKIEDREIIQRVRADIADVVLGKLDLPKGIRQVIGVGKHLCGGATDLAIRCLIKANLEKGKDHVRSRGVVFALCCHHRCDWRTYTGKRYLREHGIGQRQFELMVKMVSWAVCGSGTSRERRKSDGEEGDAIKYGFSRSQREDIGRKCKRLLDCGRMRYLERNGFTAELKMYAKSEITLENVCLIGHVK